MSAELGHLALILALLVALVQGVLPIVGAQRGHAAWIAIARPAGSSCAPVESVVARRKAAAKNMAAILSS